MVASLDNIRALRPVADPIAWYVRVGFNDHKMLENRLSAGDRRINRAVIDSACIDRHATLIGELQKRQAELVLDPRTVELPIRSAPSKSLQALPWYEEACAADPDLFDDRCISVVVAKIAACVVEHGFTSVLAPTHYLDDEYRAWMDVDVKLTSRLRAELDRLGATDVKIYYPLVIPYAWLSEPSLLRSIAGALSLVPIDAVWLRVSNFQNDKSAAAVRHYIEGARTLLRARRPLIADHVGGLSGLAIVAFGAAGGIAHGIGAREGLQINRLRNATGEGFGVPSRTYVSDVDMYLDRRALGSYLDEPAVRSSFGCRKKDCCPRGVKDIFSNSKAHHVNSRFDQLGVVGSGTEAYRPTNFIRKLIIPAGARLIKLDHALAAFPELQSRVQKKRYFVDQLKATLESLEAETRDENVQRSRIPRRVPFRPAAITNNKSLRPTL